MIQFILYLKAVSIHICELRQEVFISKLFSNNDLIFMKAGVTHLSQMKKYATKVLF